MTTRMAPRTNALQNLGAIMMIGALAPDDQIDYCRDAAAALSAGNPAAAGLMQSCGQARAINVAAGRLMTDALPPDAALRVNLTDTGTRIINGDPRLSALFKTLSPDVARGFAIGVKVARAIGGLNASYAAAIRAGMSPDNAKGFDMALATANATATTNAVNPSSASTTILGMSEPVAIAAGVGLVAALGLVAYKLTR
jgi:hypothetical protein